MKSNRYKFTVLEKLSTWTNDNFRHNGDFLTETITLKTVTFEKR